jgi:hypothetical protein
MRRIPERVGRSYPTEGEVDCFPYLAIQFLMRLKRLQVVFIALAMVIPQWACGQAHEQTAFSADDAGVKKPVALPADVLELLKNDPFASSAFKEEVPASCFSASAVRLGSRVDDLIVEAAGSLRGANGNMFWVFLTTTHGHRLVLAAPALELTVENRRSAEYRDITIVAATAAAATADSMRFNGKRYALYRQKAEVVHLFE